MGYSDSQSEALAACWLRRLLGGGATADHVENVEEESTVAGWGGGLPVAVHEIIIVISRHDVKGASTEACGVLAPIDGVVLPPRGGL
ncbi:MAG: hypothetical protein NTX77_13010 [Actinobacteria bacterium]|nr:hypothetical protein [Actinomycetota bacterium]